MLFYGREADDGVADVIVDGARVDDINAAALCFLHFCIPVYTQT